MRPHDEVKLAIVSQWITKAELDLKACEAMLISEFPLQYPVCFHAQQAAEKYFKALLTWHQIEFPKTHSIEELLDLIGKVNPELSTKLRDAVQLTPYGVELRYPGDVPEPEEQEAKEAVNLAGKVKLAVLNALPSMVK
jgi:HEPN domain-containing protein